MDALATIEGSSSKNECSSSDECGDGKCIAGQCHATEGEIDALLIEVTSPTQVATIAGVRFVKELDGLDLEGGKLDLTLGHVARVAGRVTAEAMPDEAPCIEHTGDSYEPSTDGTLPARVTFALRRRVLGLPGTLYSAEAKPGPDSVSTFSISVPPGKYDVYVEPLGGEDCARPPQLLVEQELPAADVDLTLLLPAPQYITVRVRWPIPMDGEKVAGQIESLDGWTIDVVERASGRVLSTKATLKNADAQNLAEATEYEAAIAYSPAASASGKEAIGSELVRLSPPSGVTAPTFLVERSVLELFEAGTGVIDQLSMPPAPVTVTGTVVMANMPQPVASTVTLVATDLQGISPGVAAAFQRTVVADEKGEFTVELLPGTYRAIAEPPAMTGLAAAEAEWVVAKSPAVQAGRVIELFPSPRLSGRVIDPAARHAVAGATVHAGATPGSTQTDVLSAALGQVAFVPRAEATVTGGDGTFEVLADPGTFDISVRPDSSSGFAWHVAPGVSVVAGQDLDLGSFRLPLPVVYTGEVHAADVGLVPSALIRAYAYVSSHGELMSSPDEAASVIQVAEARANAQGQFRLLLPQSFNSR